MILLDSQMPDNRGNKNAYRACPTYVEIKVNFEVM